MDDDVKPQAMLIPQIVTLADAERAALEDQSDRLAQIRLCIEIFGADSAMVREVPALIGT